MGQQLVDETGNKYGSLTVVSLTKDKNGRTAWLCNCDCGNTKIVRGSDLRTGKITSCGVKCKCKKTTCINEVGNRYGRLIVLYKSPNKDNDKIHWFCECDYGNCITVVGSDLRNGRTNSCGCLQKELSSKRMSKDISNKKFGMLTALNWTGKTDNGGNRYWDCICECGRHKEVIVHSLTSGNTISCGHHNLSKGAIKIRDYLQEHNYEYTLEYTFNDFKSQNNVLFRYDFAIFNKDKKLKCLIEFHGRQHFKPIEHFGGETEYLQRVEYDKQKEDYCKNNNIPLLIIPYDKYDDIENILFNFLNN